MEKVDQGLVKRLVVGLWGKEGDGVGGQAEGRAAGKTAGSRDSELKEM